MSDSEISQLKDNRNFNILMLASEAGHIEAVNNLIERGEEVNVEVDSDSAVNLAFSQGHHHIVLALLKANSKFPSNYQQEMASDELKAFVNLSTEIHERVDHILEDDQEELESVKNYIKEKINNYPNLRHFYDQKNNSLLKNAILCKTFAIYELLLTLNIFLGPHENMDEINEKLTIKQRKKFSEINYRLSPNFLTEPMMILLRNCKSGPDTPQKMQSEFIESIRKVFEYLFKIPGIAIILKIVAAAHNFKIIFDFNRDSVTFLDPSAEPFMNGLFYSSGKIYIAAKDMLDPSTALNTIGVISHELCHFAMFLVYDNDGKPYKRKDVKALNEFNEVTKACEKNKRREEIVESVFDDYDEEMHHAELIVRVVQMLALYFDKFDMLKARVRSFQTLFDFYARTNVPQMETELPKIEMKFNPIKRAQRKAMIQKRWIIGLTISIIIGIILSVLGFYFYYNPTITYSDLTPAEKIKFNNSKVLFHGIDVKFGELFANNSNVFNLLSSEQIKNSLNDETEELSKAIELTLDPFIFLTWQNMSENLREKFLNYEVNFQGQTILLKNLTSTEKSLNILSSLEVRNIFNNNTLKISNPVEVKVKIYIERYFIDENIKVISEELFEENLRVYNKSILSSDNWKKPYYDGVIDVNDSEVKSFETILEEVKTEKTFLLSSAAGDGKSTAFRNFALNLKEKFSTSWVQFVDLKKHSEAYKIGEKLNLTNFEEVSNFVANNLLNLNNFEREVFKELFTSGNAIFLFDGVDEISPLYKDFMIDLTANMKNFQFVSTRPQYSQDFRKKLNIKAHKLIPFSKFDRFKFLVKITADKFLKIDEEKVFELMKPFYKENSTFFNSQTEFHLTISEKLKINQTIVQDYFFKISKGLEIFEVTGKGDDTWFKDRSVSNPLLISMISELASEENFKVENSTFNSFDLYGIFIDKKFGIVRGKGEILGKEYDKIAQRRQFAILDVHQAFALKLLADNFQIRSIRLFMEVLAQNNLAISDLRIMKSFKKFTNEEISIFGILQVNSEFDYDFAHRTFAEFFAAQFVIDNIDDTEFDSKDGKMILILAQHFLIDGANIFPVVKSFLLKYIENNKKLSPFLHFWREQNLKNQKFTQKQPEILQLEKIQFSVYFNTSNFGFEGDFRYPFYNFCDEIIIRIFENLDKFKEIFGEPYLKKIFSVKGVYGGITFTQCALTHLKSNTFEIFLNTTISYFNNSQIVEFLNDKNNVQQSSTLMFAASDMTDKDLNFFWTFIEQFLNEKQQKEVLKLKDYLNQTALHYSIRNMLDIPKPFLVMKEIYKKVLTYDEIMEIINEAPLFYNAVRFGDIKIAKEVSTFTSELFKEDKIKLRNYLNDVEKFSGFAYSDEQVSNLKIFMNLLRETFDEDELDEFESYLKLFSKNFGINFNILKS